MKITVYFLYILIFKCCYYCGGKPSQIHNLRSFKGCDYERNIKYNGIDRVENSAGYTIENCVPCCGFCNRGKSVMSVDEWINHIKKVLKNHEL